MSQEMADEGPPVRTAEHVSPKKKAPKRARVQEPPPAPEKTPPMESGEKHEAPHAKRRGLMYSGWQRHMDRLSRIIEEEAADRAAAAQEHVSTDDLCEIITSGGKCVELTDETVLRLAAAAFRRD